MAISRLISQSRTLLARGVTSSRMASTVFISARTAAPRRQFTSSTWVLQEIAANQSTGSAIPPVAKPPQNSHERSIVILNFPKRLVKQDIEAFLKKSGFEVKRIQLRLDRFTFFNDSMCFIELGNAEQATEAIDLLSNKTSLGESMIASPLKQDFVWGVNGTTDKDSSRYFFQSAAGLATAVKPIFEDRRIYVQASGWGEDGLGNRNRKSREVIEQHFAKFGIEAVSKVSPNPGDRVISPRFLCWIDFKTKEGAEEAMAALGGKSIEGQVVHLEGAAALNSWRSWQIGKIDKNLLQKLQNAGKAHKKVFDKLDKYTKNANRDGKRKKKNVQKSAA